MSFKTFCGNGFSNTTKNCQTSSSHKPQYIFGWEDIKRCYATSGNNPVWKKNNVWWTLLALAHHLYNATLISKIMQSWRWKAAFIHRQTVHEIFIGNSSLFKTDFNFCSSPPPSHKRGFPTKQPVAGIRMLTAEVSRSLCGVNACLRLRAFTVESTFSCLPKDYATDFNTPQNFMKQSFCFLFSHNHDFTLFLSG